jgi:hypothetical protein
MTAGKSEANYAVADRDLKYYIFDWDDNILHMPTNIHLERRTEEGIWVPHSVSTAVFSIIRNDHENYREPQDGGWDAAFCDFRDIDVDNENVFLRDTRTAIDRVVSGEQPAGPSFDKFRTTLIEGRLFAIVTARGHSPEIIRKGVEYFIETVLTSDEKETMLRNLRGYMACFEPGYDAESSDKDVLDYYLSYNRYHGVMSPQFRAMMGKSDSSSPNTEEGKQFAIKDFVEHVIKITKKSGLDKPISVGFSDDDEGNVIAVENFVRDAIYKEFPEIKFVVYYTSDPNIPSGRKVVVRGQLGLDL